MDSPSKTEERRRYFRRSITQKHQPECRCHNCQCHAYGKRTFGIKRNTRPPPPKQFVMPNPLFDNPKRLPPTYVAYFMGGPMDGRVENVHRKERSYRPQLFLHGTEYVLIVQPTATAVAVYKDIEAIRHEQRTVRRGV